MKKPKKKQFYKKDNSTRFVIEAHKDQEEEHYFDLIDSEVEPIEQDSLRIINRPENDGLEKRVAEVDELNFDHDR